MRHVDGAWSKIVNVLCKTAIGESAQEGIRCEVLALDGPRCCVCVSLHVQKHCNTDTGLPQGSVATRGTLASARYSSNLQSSGLTCCPHRNLGPEGARRSGKTESPCHVRIILGAYIRFHQSLLHTARDRWLKSSCAWCVTRAKLCALPRGPTSRLRPNTSSSGQNSRDPRNQSLSKSTETGWQTDPTQLLGTITARVGPLTTGKVKTKEEPEKVSLCA